MEMRLKKGRGYVSADRISTRTWGSDLFRSIRYTRRSAMQLLMEAARLGQITDYDKLAIEIWTNGW